MGISNLNSTKASLSGDFRALELTTQYKGDLPLYVQAALENKLAVGGVTSADKGEVFKFDSQGKLDNGHAGFYVGLNNNNFIVRQMFHLKPDGKVYIQDRIFLKQPVEINIELALVFPGIRQVDAGVAGRGQNA